MASLSELRVQKHFLVLWIGVCITLAVLITIFSSLTRQDLLLESQLVSETRVIQSQTEGQLERILLTDDQLTESFYLENFSSLVQLPQSHFYSNSQRAAAQTAMRLEKVLEARKTLNTQRNSMHQALAGVQKMDCTQPEKSATYSADAKEICSQVGTAAAAIHNWAMENPLRDDYDAEKDQKYLGEKITEAEHELNAWLEHHSELNKLNTRWKNFVSITEKVLESEISYVSLARQTRNALLSLRMHLNEDFARQKDYAEQANTLYMGALLFLLLNLIVAFWVAFRSRHYTAMNGESGSDVRVAEFEAITEQLESLHEAIQKTWSDTNDESRIFESIMESTSDLEEKMNHIDHRIKANLEQEKEELAQLLDTMKEAYEQEGDVIRKVEMLPILKKMQKVSRRMLDEETAITEEMEDMTRTEKTMISELHRIEASIRVLREDAQKLQAQDREVEESESIIRSSMN